MADVETGVRVLLYDEAMAVHLMLQGKRTPFDPSLTGWPAEHCNNPRRPQSVCVDFLRFIALFCGPGPYAGMSSKCTPSPRRSALRAF